MNRLIRVLGWCVFLALAACAGPQPPPAQTGKITAVTTPVILISLDGFRADYLDRGLTPNIAALAAAGVRATAMRPAFPSVTFPNHYSIVTGLYPDHHGIVNNTMEDPAIPGVRFTLSNKAAQDDERWWDEATPLWVTAERQGLGAATIFWPGSDRVIHGMRPNYWKAYDKTVPDDARVDTILGWLDLPVQSRPSFLTLYMEDVDTAGHDSGPDSAGVDEALRHVDVAIGRLTDGLRQRGLLDRVNMIIVADHGMAATSPDRVVFLDDWVDAKSFHLISGGAVAGVSPEPAQTAAVERALLAPHDHVQCWRKADIPPRLHYGANPRVPPIVCLAEIGWILTTHADAAKQKTFSLGQHGYDGADPLMRALFVAHGPAFRQGLVVTQGFDNVDVYPLMTNLLGIKPEANDGNLADIAEMLNAGM
jgi:predicted AlkP superfamily pyrophosphatase or phosphodiesterase